MKRNNIIVWMIVSIVMVATCISLCGCKQNTELTVVAFNPGEHKGIASFDAFIGLKDENQSEFNGTLSVKYEYGVVGDSASQSKSTTEVVVNNLGSVSNNPAGRINYCIQLPHKDIWYRAIATDQNGNTFTSDPVIVPFVSK